MKKWHGGGTDVSYVCFIDPDDFIDSCMLSKMLEEAQDGKADLIVTGAKKGKNLNAIELKKAVLNTNDNIFFGDAFSSCWGKLFKKSIIEENSLRFPLGVKYGEDGIFVFLYLASSSFIYIADGNFYNYFNNPSSACHNVTSEILKGRMDAIKNLERYIAQKGRLNDFSNGLFHSKHATKSAFALFLRRPDFNEFLAAFPEIDSEFLSKVPSPRARFYFSLIYKRHFLLASALFFASKPLGIFRRFVKRLLQKY